MNPYHAANCLCADCISDRRAEVDARRDEAAARKEELAGKYSAFLERTMGPVRARLGMPKPMPGTLRAIAARYGRRAG